MSLRTRRAKKIPSAAQSPAQSVLEPDLDLMRLRHQKNYTIFKSKIWILCAALALVLIVTIGGIYLYLGQHAQLVPVLMYHNFAQESKSYLTVTPERFEEHMAAIAKAGYHTLTVDEMIDYVENGTPLPKRCVLLTFDDGYLSNLELAAPILEKYDLHAVIFAVGTYTADLETARDSETPFFTLSEALPYIRSGVIEVQSHTYNMHTDIYGRLGLMPMEGESEEDYRAALSEDCALQRALFEQDLGQAPTALAFPYGASTPLTDTILKDEGIQATFGGNYDYNYIWKGKPESLYMLGRYGVIDDMPATEVLSFLRPGIRRTLSHLYHHYCSF